MIGDQPGALVDSSTRVLVLSTDGLGDQILRAPLLVGLAESGAEVIVVARESVAAVIPRIHPELQTLTTSLAPWLPRRDAAEEDRLLTAIEANPPDLVVHAPFVVHAANGRLLHRLADHRRAGLADRGDPEKTAGLLDGAASCAGRDHEVKKAVALLHVLVGDEAAARVDNQPRLRLEAEDQLAAERVAGSLGLDPGGYAVVVPGSTINQAGKQWRADGIAAVIAGMERDHDLPALLVGAESDTALLADAVSECTRIGVHPRVWVGGAEELSTTLGLVVGSRLAVGIDSGVIHAAAALGIPVVASYPGAQWPRFLPRAERLGVVTRWLACFNCEWQCWLDRPACLVHEPGPYLELIEWALAGHGPGTEIRELAPDPELEQAAREAAAARRREPAWQA